MVAPNELSISYYTKRPDSKLGQSFLMYMCVQIAILSVYSAW